MLNDSLLFEQLYNYVENDEDSTKLYNWLVNNTTIGQPKSSMKLVNDHDENMYFSDEDDDNDDVYDDNGNNKSHEDDEVINNKFDVTERVDTMDMSLKDKVKKYYEYINQSGKSFTTNNGLTSQVLGFNGQLSVAPLQFLVHYIHRTETIGFGIDFGGGYGKLVFLLAVCSKWKIVSTEINFER